jgi:hypothetical protein
VVSGSAGESSPLEAVLLQLAELRDQVTLVEAAQQRDAERIDELTTAAKGSTDESDEKGYKPVPAPRWWQLDGRERTAAIARLRSWVDTVYRPGYGHLAAKLGPCWERHDLCLYLLDWLSEMHTFLYQPGDRGWGLLAGQADWHTRFLPVAVAQMDEETHSCDHLHPSDVAAVAGGDPWAGTR